MQQLLMVKVCCSRNRLEAPTTSSEYVDLLELLLKNFEAATLIQVVRLIDDAGDSGDS